MKLIFNDATEITVQQVIESGGSLTIKTINNTPEQLRVLFTDPLKTARMIARDRGMEDVVYERYTDFYRTEEYEGKIYGVTMNQVGQSIEERVSAVESDAETFKQEIKDLQEGGGGSAENYSAVYAMARISAMAITDDAQALEVQSLYDTWDGDGVAYKTGTYLNYNDVLYKVLQDHTSQAGWSPDAAPSLFAKVLTDPSGKILPWEQPDSTNPYAKGDKVTHSGKTWESTADGNVWEPGTTGAPWKEVEE